MKNLIVYISLIFALNLSATIINIPLDQPTIQEGISFATENDTILVQPGTYIENINFNGKNITLASLFLTTQDTSYISQTIIDGNQNGSVVTFENQEDSTAVLTGFKITNGYGSGSGMGGGITCKNEVNPKILNTLITDNESELYGGGIYCSHSSIYLNNVTISSNASGFKGGGIYGLLISTDLINIDIIDNISSYGGGFHLDVSTSNFDNVTISENYASNFGGGINSSESYLLINSTTIINNEANFGGGGISSVSNSNLILNNVDIFNNFAQGEGGAIRSSNSNLNIENIEIANNSTLYNGGGFYIFNTELEMLNCRFINNNCGDNTVDGRGGALYIMQSSIDLSQCDFLHNHAISHAGAIYLKTSSAFINECSFVENISEGNVGGLYYYSSSQLEIINCTFFNNIGTDCGAMRFYIEAQPTSIPIIKNTISWNNSPTEIFCSEYGWPTSLIISYSDIEGGEESIAANNYADISWDDTNFNNNPIFVDPLLGDIHLSENSPCIDTGDPSSILDPDGTVKDIGAFFFDQSVVIYDYETHFANYSLSNYPNPFNPITTIDFSIQNNCNVKLSVFNIKGQKIKDLTHNNFTQGSHSIIWNGDDESEQPVSSGIYLFKLNVNGKTEAVKKCLLLK